MRLVIVLGSALAFAPAASAGLPNPCALLTNAEAGKVLGGTISDRSAGGGGGRFRMCTWTGPNEGGFFQSRPKLTVQVSRGTKAQLVRSARTTAGAVRIAGVGQFAFAVQQTGGFLYVWQHGFTLFVAVSLGANSISTEKQAAKLMVKRL